MKGRTKGQKNSTQLTGHRLIVLFTDEDSPKYVGTYLNKVHAAERICEGTDKSRRSMEGNIQKYLAYKLHTLNGFIPQVIDLKGNPLDRIPRQLIDTAKEQAKIRRNMSILSRMTVAEASKLSRDQVERIALIIQEK